jgi:outer membrane immunogenic protein
MKKLFLGSVALVALGLGTPAAFAAERPVPAPAYTPPPPPVPVYTWSGCYAGANAGTSSGKATQTTNANSIVTGGPLGVPAPALLPANSVGSSIAGDLNLSGFIGGFQGGCNYQFGAWVVGAEVDGMATNKEGQNFETSIAPFAGPGSATFISQTQERWLLTARGKLGLAGWGWFGDKSLVYITGGAAWAKIDTSEFQVGAQPNTGHQESNTRTGWTVGAGYEYALGYGWSIKGEYLYVKFDNFTTFTQPPFGAGDIAPRSVKLNDNIVRAGMNYKFYSGGY